MTAVPASVRIALANLRYPASPEEAVALAVNAVADAGAAGAAIVCFPECYVPGYRRPGGSAPRADPAFLEQAWSEIATAAAAAAVAVVLGTERVEAGAVVATALVINADGSRLGFQDKVQIAPSEKGTYTPGAGRRLFAAGGLTFGVAICHEGWRYPETVRWSAVRGAQLVFHPHFHETEPGACRPVMFGDPANTFHEKAALCRAAENTCWFATVNCASEGSTTTSAVIDPQGKVLAWQPYGLRGLLLADIDPAAATGMMARRLRASEPDEPDLESRAGG